jgi:hypothetical protein
MRCGGSHDEYVSGVHPSAGLYDAHDAHAPYERPIRCAAANGLEQARLKTIDLPARIAKSGDANDHCRADADQGA